jgi:hypothetical protein
MALEPQPRHDAGQNQNDEQDKYQDGGHVIFRQ